jgi:hypothetical protein
LPSKQVQFTRRFDAAARVLLALGTGPVLPNQDYQFRFGTRSFSRDLKEGNGQAVLQHDTGRGVWDFCE